MKKKLIITESQYNRLKSNLNEGLSERQNIINAANHKGASSFEEILGHLVEKGISYDANLITLIGENIIEGIKYQMESHYTDLAPNAGAAPDEYDDDGMTYDQFGGETHGY